MDILEVLRLGAVERVTEPMRMPQGVEHAIYRMPEYPYAGNGGQVGLYAICSEDEVLFVDCGPSNMTDHGWFSSILDTFAGSSDQASLFLTHCHCDHMGDAPWFANQGINPQISAGSEALGSMDAGLCETIMGAKHHDISFGISEYCAFQAKLWESVPQLTKVQEWDLLKVGDKKFEVMPLPGHADGHCGLISKDRTMLFSGDALCQMPPVFSYRIDSHDVAAAIDCWSELMAYPLEWIVTTHEGIFEGEDDIKDCLKDQINHTNTKAKRVLEILREMPGYHTACGFLSERKGESKLRQIAQVAKYRNMLSLEQDLAFLEFLYDYEQINRYIDDEGCAVYEPARFNMFFS